VSSGQLEIVLARSSGCETKGREGQEHPEHVLKESLFAKVSHHKQDQEGRCPVHEERCQVTILEWMNETPYITCNTLISNCQTFWLLVIFEVHPKEHTFDYLEPVPNRSQLNPWYYEAHQKDGSQSRQIVHKLTHVS